MQVLLTIDNEPVGADGVVHDPGTVTTAVDEALNAAGFALQGTWLLPTALVRFDYSGAVDVKRHRH